METVLGLVGKDFVLLACESSTVRSIMRLKEGDDKLLPVGKQAIMGISGEAADRVAFGEYIQRNMAFYALKSGVTLSTHAVANFTRNTLAQALRKGPYQANLLLAGWDKNHGASLYYIDYLASMHKVNKAAHGYASYFTLGAMDKYWKPNMSLDEAVDLLKKCIHELRTRFIIGQPSFIVKVVDASGVRTIDLGQL